MKTKTHILFLFISLTIMSCSTASKISKESSLKNKKELACKNLAWYRFINGKPDRFYLESAKKVAERWGFKIIYELGNCTNTEEERQKEGLSDKKSADLFKCLTKNYGENWKNKFREEVKAESQK